MSLECGADGDLYVDLSADLQISAGTEFCVECRRLIPCGEPHHLVREWGLNEEGDEIEFATHACCEVCGDLALSFLDLGYCWSYGDLRNDIAELNNLWNRRS